MVTKIDWISRWEEGRTGFHEGRPNVHLVAHFSGLNVPKGGRIFVPLCGKTVDIHWLLGGGYRVAGAELSELAIGELFEELRAVPEISELGDLKLYSADGIDIFVGDIYDLSAAQLGDVDAVYDRAAFVALPEDMRGRYADHVADVSGGAAQLLITYAYDAGLMSGPPFNIPDGEVRARYGAAYDVVQVDQQATGGLRGVAAEEHVWLLYPLSSG